MMFSIIEHIEYLMTRHDCVVIPGWGAFIANYSSAGYDQERAVFVRPYRTIGFNAGVRHNDGMLVQSLMLREGLSYDEAMRFIKDSVTAFGKQLSMGNEVSMGRLGYFLLGEGQHTEFVPFERNNASDAFFGLADVDVRTVTALEQARRQEAEDVAAIVPRERGLFTRRAAGIAASVAVLLGLSVMLTTPIIADRDHAQASMAPSVTAPQSQPLGMMVQEGVVPQAFTYFGTDATFGGVGNTSGKYYMVIATLRNQQELDAFKAKYASLVPHMKMLDYKGMTCVYVARSDNYEELMTLRDALPEALRDVWIYN